MYTHYRALTNAISIMQYAAIFYPDMLINLQRTETTITLTIQCTKNYQLAHSVKDDLGKLALEGIKKVIGDYIDQEMMHVIFTWEVERPDEDFI